MRFKNITYIEERNLYQLKLKFDGKEFQPAYKSLTEAIINRNNFYLDNKIYPCNLFIRSATEQSITEINRQHRNGNSYNASQVNAYRLVDRKYSPKQFIDPTEAESFMNKWLKVYNEIVQAYNKVRLAKFIDSLIIELETLTPTLETGFDKSLWRESAILVMGKNIPCYFNGDGYQSIQL